MPLLANWLKVLQDKFSSLDRSYQKHKVNEERTKLFDCIDSIVTAIDKSAIAADDKAMLKAEYLAIKEHFTDKRVQTLINQLADEHHYIKSINQDTLDRILTENNTGAFHPLNTLKVKLQTRLNALDQSLEQVSKYAAPDPHLDVEPVMDQEDVEEDSSLFNALCMGIPKFGVINLRWPAGMLEEILENNDKNEEGQPIISSEDRETIRHYLTLVAPKEEPEDVDAYIEEHGSNIKEATSRLQQCMVEYDPLVARYRVMAVEALKANKKDDDEEPRLAM